LKIQPARSRFPDWLSQNATRTPPLADAAFVEWLHELRPAIAFSTAGRVQVSSLSADDLFLKKG
jgi:hypothetical protein